MSGISTFLTRYGWSLPRKPLQQKFESKVSSNQVEE